jgi:hypothetical protein
VTTVTSTDAAESLPDLPVTFLPARTRALLLSSGTALLAVLTVIAVLLPHDGARPWGPGARAGIVGTGVWILGVLMVLSRPKVMADPSGVTVVNLTTTRRLAWAEIVRVNLRTGDAWVQLDLADGTTLAVMGIQPGINRKQAIRDARSLRALAEAHGTAAREGARRD